MLSLYDEASNAAALGTQLDPRLHALLMEHLEQAASAGLADATHIVVIQPGDDENLIETEMGFSPLVHPIDGERFGTSAFVPYWAWFHDLGGWHEMIVPVGNSGFAFVLLIQEAPGVLPDLLALCRAYGSADPCV